ncbi:DNA replication complex GINS protein SLD5 isoform X2 [Carex littledalei]|uniref:DNA replication complex GINS protein SLD5 n=1 Tax=Carex littledalei TaxID=544730 RepID=A0A833VD34_9POAL|nr:DNA replication complex GINS protein SLD5 isoform X2 [Carex littledalei]
MESWEEEGSVSGSGLGAGTDVELVRQAWRNEKAAPEILPFEEALVRRLREQIQLQEERAEELKSEGMEDVVVSLHHMDSDRALFLLKSYLRLRLHKIEKHLFFYSSHTHLFARLSPEEQLFCNSCVDIMTQHLKQSVLNKLPQHYQSVTRQSTSSEDDDMVDSPQLDTFVFCKTKTDVGAFQLDDTGEEIVDLVVDDLYVLRYKSIRGLVESGQINLI